MKQFRNKGGEFLEKVRTETIDSPDEPVVHRRRGRPKQIQTYRFSEHFEAAARSYLRGTITMVLRIDVEITEIDRLLNVRGKQLFREVIEIIRQSYFPTWEGLFSDVAKAIAAPGIEAELTSHAPYWVIMLAACRQLLENRPTPLDEESFYVEVKYALRVVDKNEVARCVRYLADKGILQRGSASSGETTYVLSDPMLPAVEKYTKGVAAARERLVEYLKQQLKGR